MKKILMKLILLNAFVALIIASENDTTVLVSNDEVGESMDIETTTSIAEETTSVESQSEEETSEKTETIKEEEIDEKIENKVTDEEEVESLTSTDDIPKNNGSFLFPFGDYNEFTAPSSIDYRKFVMFFYDQKDCKGSWAFAVTSQIEILQKYRNVSYNTPLSPQYLLDCSNGEGCKGGWPAQTFKWLKKSSNNKMPSIDDYPLFINSNVMKNTCEVLKEDNFVPLKIEKVVEFRNFTDEQMKVLVANYGPITVAIHATEHFFAYKSGIFNDKTYSTDSSKLNHVVVIVGYGTDRKTGKNYWLIKNSFGVHWGEDGYIRMERSKSGCIRCYPTFIY